MRAYAASSEEALRARSLLKDCAGQGFLTGEQYHSLEQETVCDLRRTNIFLRLVLWFFTLIIVAAGLALFFEVILSRPSTRTTGVFVLIFSVLSYAAAEFAASQFRLYRYGIEEALAACSGAFLCFGIQLVLFESGSSNLPSSMQSIVPAAGLIGSLWIWHRFGLPYAFLAATLFAFWLPAHWTSSHSAQHVVVAAIYAVGLGVIAVSRPRYHFTYLDQTYSIAEALLWLGVYLAINLQLSSIDLLRQWWIGLDATEEFSRSFYWTTWVLTWCIPSAALVRGLRRRDRFVIAAGAIAAVLTLITNKPYLGWPRHTWDAMILGALLVGAALLIRRWLAAGPAGIRHGFTAQRLSGKDKSWMNVGGVAVGLVAPTALSSQPSPEFRFGGGDSGGGGASSDF